MNQNNKTNHLKILASTGGYEGGFMSVIINALIAGISTLAFLHKIIEGNIDIILLSVAILTLINTISFIKKNKENYNLSNSYYFFIRTVNDFYKNKEFDKLQDFLKHATKTDFYQKLHVENSDMPIMDTLRQYHDED